MLKKNYTRIIAIILALSIISVYPAIVLAKDTVPSNTTTHINDIAGVNVAIVTEFNSAVDPNANYAVNLEYDEQKRITKIIAKSGTTEEIVSIVHDGDGNYSKSSMTHNIEVSSEINATSSGIQSYAGTGNYDSKMADASVKNRIEEAQSLWTKANENSDSATKERAHLEAEIARTDYCVVYPKSSFALAFLESGSLDTDTGFRRQISYTEPQMYGSDIMAIQRALINYGYMDTTDVAFEQYGYYGPTTQAAVNDYQSEVLGISPTGTVAGKTIASMFSGSSSSNQSQASFGDLNRINIFRLKHDYVATATAMQLHVSGTTVWTDPNTYIAGAGVKGKGGRADIIRDGWGAKSVWEVKPDSAYGTSWLAGAQIESYRTASKLPANASRAYCPITYLGSDITPFSIPWAAGYTVLVTSTPTNGSKYAGIVYYRDIKNGSPVFVPVPVPEKVTLPQIDYKRVTFPEPQTVLNGALAITGLVIAYYIVKGVIAIAAAAPSGGTSLLLLCF